MVKCKRVNLLDCCTLGDLDGWKLYRKHLVNKSTVWYLWRFSFVTATTRLGESCRRQLSNGRTLNIAACAKKNRPHGLTGRFNHQHNKFDVAMATTSFVAFLLPFYYSHLVACCLYCHLVTKLPSFKCFFFVAVFHVTFRKKKTWNKTQCVARHQLSLTFSSFSFLHVGNQMTSNISQQGEVDEQETGENLQASGHRAEL